MRDPPRKAAVFAGIVVLAAGLAWVGWRRHEPGGGDWLPATMVAVGGLLAFYATLMLLRALLHVRGMRRLEAGFGCIAQWRVSAADWDAFRAVDAERVAADRQFLVNDLAIRRQAPSEGVDVTIGETSLLADGSYHVLRPNGLPALRSIGWIDHSATSGRPPDCLEFVLAYPRGRYGGTMLMGLRVPVPGSARELGRKVYDHYAPVLERREARVAPALRNPRLTLQICGAVLVAGLAAAGWGWFEAERAGWSIDASMLPLFLIIGGGLAVLFAVVLGSLTLLLRPKPPR